MGLLRLTLDTEFTFFLQNLPFLLVSGTRQIPQCLFILYSSPPTAESGAPTCARAPTSSPPFPSSQLAQARALLTGALLSLLNDFPTNSQDHLLPGTDVLVEKIMSYPPSISVPPGPAHGMKVLLVLVLVHCPSLDPVLPLTYYLITFDLIFPIIRDAFHAPPTPCCGLYFPPSQMPINTAMSSFKSTCYIISFHCR